MKILGKNLVLLHKIFLFSLATSVLLLFPKISRNIVAAQNTKAAYQKYVTSDFVGAEKLFKQALGKARSSSDRAYIHKMLGITQYMQGKAKTARESFEMAKKISPNIEIQSTEVLDESVIRFFNSIKAPKPKPKPKPPKPKPKKITTAPKPPPPRRAPAPRRLPPRRPPRAKAPKVVVVEDNSFLEIRCNIRNAQVYIDGNSVGSADQVLKVTPGIRQVRITASGYRDRVKSVHVKKDHHVILNEHFSNSDRKAPKKEYHNSRRTVKEKVRPRKKSKSRKAPKEDSFMPPKKRAKKSSRKKPDSILYFLPFGIGQFANGDTAVAAGFLASQAAFLAYGMQLQLDANAKTVETNDEIERREAARAELPEDQQQADVEDTLNFRADQSAEIDQMLTNSNISLGLFGLLWAGSVVQAFSSASKPVKSKSRNFGDLEIRPNLLLSGRDKHIKLDPTITLKLDF